MTALLDKKLPDVLPLWKKVFREGVAPLISDEGLLALRQALIEDDQRLIQGATTTPPPLMCVEDWPVEAACALGFVGWQGDGLETVGETEEFFARMAYEVDQRMGEPAAVRYWLNHWDDTPRELLFAQTLIEVGRELRRRKTDPPVDAG